MTMDGSVQKRCGCRQDGIRLGAACPLLAERRHGSWQISVELGTGVDGRRRRVRRGGYSSRRAAEQALARIRQVRGPADQVARTLSTGRWLTSWLAGHLALRPSTRRMYTSHLRVYLVPQLGSIALADLSAGHVRTMVASIITGHKQADRRLSPTTLARVLATLRTALNAAIREGLIEVNVARHVELPPARRPHPRVWTENRVAVWRSTGERPAVAVWSPGHVAAFLHAVRYERMFPLFHLIALRGLRRGEACGLRWCDVDLNAGTVEISHQVLDVDGRLTFAPPKSVASNRLVALDVDTLRVLTDHRHLCPNVRSDGPVFPAENGGFLRPERITRTFNRLVTRHGLPPVRLHDLRHGAASLALAAGADLKTVQDMLGHASIVLTADTYTSVLPDVGRAAAEGIAALVRDAGRFPPGQHELTPGGSRRVVARTVNS